MSEVTELIDRIMTGAAGVDEPKADEDPTTCPDCGSQIVPSEGCAFCPSCGWSPCK